MKNSEYWTQRFTQLEAAQNAIGADAMKDIERQYQRAQRQIEGQIAAWYQRFAENNNITLTEARKWLAGKDLKEFKWDVQEYIKYGEENAIDGRWVKELENASAKWHISRLEALKAHVRQSLEELFAKQGQTVTKTMGETYRSGYYHTAYELQKGFSIGFDIAGVDQAQVEKVLAKPWAADGYNFSERIWRNKNRLITEIYKELSQNILLGADPQKAVDAVAKKMNTSKNNAGRLVMTEEAYFSSLAQKDCFTDLDVEQYEIVATLDTHTSEICREMDGKVFPMSEYQPGTTAPPFHVWCRSTTVPHFDDDFGQIGERAARDKDGKTYYVPADMKYKEWQKAFVNGGDKDVLVERIDDRKASSTDIEKNDKDADKPVTKAEIEALDYYASGDGMYINHPLREDQQLNDKDKALVEDLDSATDRPIGEDMVVYRSVSAKAIFGNLSATDYENLRSEIIHGFKEPLYAAKNEMYLKQAQGKIITEKGYMSTTKDFEIASEFGDFTGADDPVVIELKVPKTARGIDLTKVDMPGAYKQAEMSDPQKEILLARGQKYCVNEITKREGNIYIKAEMLEGKIFAGNSGKDWPSEMAQEGKLSMIPNSIRGNFEDFKSLSLSESEKQTLTNLNTLSVSDGFEHGVFFKDGHQVDTPFDSSLEDRVKIDISKIMPGTSIFHSHTNETPFSTQDFSHLLNENVEKIGVITYNGDTFIASVGNGLRPTKEEFEQITNDIEKSVVEDLQENPDFLDWTLEQRNYMFIREKSYRIAREFGWTLEGGRIDGQMV